MTNPFPKKIIVWVLEPFRETHPVRIAIVTFTVLSLYSEKKSEIILKVFIMKVSRPFIFGEASGFLFKGEMLFGWLKGFLCWAIREDHND